VPGQGRVSWDGFQRVASRIRCDLAHMKQNENLGNATSRVQRSLCREPQAGVADVYVGYPAGGDRRGRVPRSADLLLCGLCAEYLAAELHNAGLSVVRA
jgi:hypothetical protein